MWFPSFKRLCYNYSLGAFGKYRYKEMDAKLRNDPRLTELYNPIVGTKWLYPLKDIDDLCYDPNAYYIMNKTCASI
jgi:hypothetical protein